MFKLPKLKGSLVPQDRKEIIYFSCDYDYFDRHGYALSQSINRTLSWLHVHCHIINEGNIDHQVLKSLSARYKFTYTWEDIDNDFYKSLDKNNKKMKEGIDIFKTRDLDYIARRTYLASARFMRLHEIFNCKEQHILALDCDTVLKNGFHKSDFVELSKHVGVMPKPKDPAVFIASALTLGTGDKGLEYRELLSTRMQEGFIKGCYWFIDQDILKEVIREWVKDRNNEFNKIPYKWNSWGLKRDDTFTTGKGNKKNDRRYKAAQLPWLPQHWRTIVESELRAINSGK
jgi:hypothetical protein